MSMRYRYMESPVGRLLVAGDETGLRYIGFSTGKDPLQPESAWKEDGNALREAIRQLHAYFEGELKAFSLELAPRGTPFQLRVLSALQEIPYGQIISYGELARRIDKPSASRAVGAANARNPLPIVIPCHRVIGSDGSLTGFGGGLDVKKALLALERRYR
jgi:methylated-DNA-[protein]-cysteine S-methyltransferase